MDGLTAQGVDAVARWRDWIVLGKHIRPSSATKIAKALGVPENEVLKAAGLIPRIYIANADEDAPAKPQPDVTLAGVKREDLTPTEAAMLDMLREQVLSRKSGSR